MSKNPLSPNALLTEDSQRSLFTETDIWNALKTVIDPELNIDIVSLGLVYFVAVYEVTENGVIRQAVRITMTLTTPGCPLAGVFDSMLRNSLVVVPGLDIYNDVDIELTFDPPWVPDMMTEEAKAELGMD
jgi:metal-sulfur cluster biosynthetic enzyme